MAFPDDRLDITIEFAFGADPTTDPSGWTWTDVTNLGGDSDASRILVQDITITRGRSDEASETDPAQVTFELDNGDGYLTPDDERSPLWPNIVTGTPVRITVEGSPRFVGQVGSWSMQWPYGDNAANADPDVGEHPTESRVLVEAAGILRRLGQGAAIPFSSMRRAFARRARPILESGNDTVSYYPLEHNSARSPSDGTSYFRFMPTTSGRARLQRPVITDQVDSPATLGALELPPAGDFAPEGPFSARAPLTSQPGQPWSATAHIVTGAWNDTDEMDVFFAVTSASSEVTISNGVLVYGRIYVDTNYVEVGYRRIVDGSTVVNVSNDVQLPSDVTFTSGRLLTITMNAAGTQARLWVDGTFRVAVSFAAHADNTSVGQVLCEKMDFTGFDADQFYGGKPAWYSHVLFVSGPDATWETNATFRSILTAGANAHVGEPAAARFARLCEEDWTQVTTIGTGVPMGPQRPMRLTDLLKEVATTDLGVITESRDTLGLEYTAGDARYDRFPAALELDASADEVTNPLVPVSDDLNLRNDVTITTPSEDIEGATVESRPSIELSGRYRDGYEVNPANAGHPAQVAASEVYRGTWPGVRYREVSVDLAASPSKIPEWVDVVEGEWLTLSGLPVQHPEGMVALVMEGLSETFSPTSWKVSVNCTPAGPWIAGTLANDPPLPPPDYDARLDTEACELVAAIDEDDTTFDVETTAGPPWVNSTDHPDEFPLLIEVAGEVMTVTAATPMSSGVQTFTVTRGDDARAHDAGTAVMVAQPLIAPI